MWLDEDRSWALALQAEEDDECPGCGHPVEESMASENEFNYTATRFRCHACTTKAKQSQKDVDEAPGLMHGVRRNS